MSDTFEETPGARGPGVYANDWTRLKVENALLKQLLFWASDEMADYETCHKGATRVRGQIENYLRNETSGL